MCCKHDIIILMELYRGFFVDQQEITLAKVVFFKLVYKELPSSIILEPAENWPCYYVYTDLTATPPPSSNLPPVVPNCTCPPSTTTSMRSPEPNMTNASSGKCAYLYHIPYSCMSGWQLSLPCFYTVTASQNTSEPPTLPITQVVIITVCTNAITICTSIVIIAIVCYQSKKHTCRKVNVIIPVRPL